MGILWFRVHNWWVDQLREYGEVRRAVTDAEYEEEELWVEDEWLFNRARQLTIATHQHIVYTEWLPEFIPRKFLIGDDGRRMLPPYASTEGYSAYFDRTGYNPAINPQIAHIFQSAAMRFGHTIVTPGIWRRQPAENSDLCLFGSPISEEMEGLNSFLRSLAADSSNRLTLENVTVNSFMDVIDTFYTPYVGMSEEVLMDTHTPGLVAIILRVRDDFNYDPATYRDSNNPNGRYFAVRTCNGYWNPQVPIRETDVDPMYLGMASQAGEREDTIITPDLRGKVCASQY